MRLGPREITRLVVERKWLVVGFIVGAILLVLPTPLGLTRQGMAVMIAVFQVLLLGVSSREVARSFMSDSVFFIMGSLMLAVAIVKQNLDRRIALFILNLTGPKISRIVFGVVTVSAIIASFIGEHTVAAMMLPVGITL
ncbi:MAG: anion transporter, partial [Deltaproteobacteria bacterium]|nr:anion transporter [Deltaproteobacteria bacterium]